MYDYNETLVGAGKLTIQQKENNWGHNNTNNTNVINNQNDTNNTSNTNSTNNTNISYKNV